VALDPFYGARLLILIKIKEHRETKAKTRISNKKEVCYLAEKQAIQCNKDVTE
jgi:hypothetical protein